MEGKPSREESVVRLAQRYDPDPAHSQQVRRLALKIFDGTALLHQLDDGARELLEYACILHDIGWSGGESKHKRRSYKMVKSGTLYGFSDAEREVIASVARYHGVKPPGKKHQWNKVLSSEDKKKVRYLSAIIRIADALDTSHKTMVEDFACSTLPANTPHSPGTDALTDPPHTNCQSEASAPPSEERKKILLKLRTSAPPDEEIRALQRKKAYFEEIFETSLEVV